MMSSVAANMNCTASHAATMATTSTTSTQESGYDGYGEGLKANAADGLPCAFSSKGFFGRSKELEMLHKLKDQVVIGGSSSKVKNGAAIDTPETLPLPAVLIWGVSGTGKSHLIQQFLDETKHRSPCYTLQGKYDEKNGTNDPFSAIVQALDDFSSQLRSGPVEELERIRSSVKAAFGDGGNQSASSVLSALINVVPSLSILLDNYRGGSSIGGAGSATHSSTFESASIASSSSSQHSILLPASADRGGINESVWNRLQYIFLQFIKAISTKERPVYFFLDDLQWSSPVALELLSNLISDSALKHFLLLGSIRQEINPHNDVAFKVATNSPLNTSFLSRLQAHSKELTEITIRNLSLEDTKHFLSNLLNGHPIDGDLHDLAQKIHSKTQGNIFFTIQALEELQRNQVLVYDHITTYWKWTLDGANGDDISISSNIAGVIESKLKQLPQDLQQVLSMAAYVKATFDVATLLHVVQNEQRCAGASSMFINTTKAIDEEYLTTLLEKAVLEQLLSNPIGGSKYRFTHDRIQEVAYGMIPHGEVRSMLRLRIGHCLLRLYQGYDDADLTGPTENRLLRNQVVHQGNDDISTEEDHGLLFVAVDHLNSVPTKDHLFSAMLNLEVGEHAFRMAAMASAAGYLEKAMTSLKLVRNPWEEQYDICMRLYRAQSDVELSLGHFQLGRSLGEEVLKKAKTLDEKLPTNLSISHALGRQDKHVEAFSICLSAAVQMGLFPKRWYLGHIARDTMKIKAFFKKNDDDAILQLPFITDERNLMSMKLMTELGTRATLTASMGVWVVNICKQIRSSIKFGLCEDSAVAFAAYGMLSEATGDQVMALRCSDLAKRIISKTGGKSLSGLVFLLTAAYIIPYKSPTANVIQDHQRGYKCSMEAGEFELGFINWQTYTAMAFLAGYELQYLMQTIETTLQQYKIYNVESVGNMAAEYFSMMQRLTGSKTIDWNEIEECAHRDIKHEKLDPSQLMTMNFYVFCRMVLATYFRKYDLGNKLASSYCYAVAENKTCFAIISKGLYTGLNAAGMYHETGKRKYLRMLNKTLTELKYIVKTKGPRFIHHVLMLKAELTSIQKHKQHSRSAKEAYDLAILMASEASFTQDIALTCELAGEHCIREGCSKAETSAYFVKAAGHYADWGCVVKVNDLKQRRPEYLAGLDENSRANQTNAEDGRVVLFGNHTSSAGRARVDVLSSYTPSMPLVGASIADSATKKSHGLYGQNIDEAEGDDDDNLSVLTGGS